MTQDEVDKIYAYLHENYEYRGGELIRAKKISGSYVGKKFGSVFIPSNKGRPTIRGDLNIEGKIRSINLDRAIFIYHTRTNPMAINHIDKNPFNNNIENLEELSLREMPHMHASNFKGIKSYKGRNGTRYYPYINNRTFGGYPSFEEAHAAYLKIKTELKSFATNEEAKIAGEQVIKKYRQALDNLADR